MYLIFDLETVVDESRVWETERKLLSYDSLGNPIWEDKAECVERVREEHCKDSNYCFMPARYHAPVVGCFLAVDPCGNYLGHRAIGEEDNATLASVTAHCWDFIENASNTFGTQTFVTFNGGRFDFPVLEVSAHHIRRNIQFWHRGFDLKPWDNPRHRYGNAIHLDLLQHLASTSGGHGGLSYWSRLFGLPGKLDTEGDMVSDLLAEGRVADVVDYCWCDVLNTYGLLLESMRAMGYQPSGGSRSPAFENTLKMISDGRGEELQRYWKIYGTEIPF